VKDYNSEAKITENSLFELSKSNLGKLLGKKEENVKNEVPKKASKPKKVINIRNIRNIIKSEYNTNLNAINNNMPKIRNLSISN